MSRVAVVTDTTHYLPAELVAELGVSLVSLYAHWDGRQDREGDLPGFGPFYEYLARASDLPTTSQPSVGDFLEIWQPLLDDGRNIVSIHISGSISGTCEAARQAQAELADRGLAERVAVVDSGTACGGLGSIAMAACARARAGANLEEVAAQARLAAESSQLWFAVDTLEFLRRGGRIGAAQAWVGSAMKIKPILTFDGEIKPVERVRTSARARERLFELMSAAREQGADAWYVQHIQAPEEVERLAERGREAFGTEPLFVSEVGPVMGTHIGPGMLGGGVLPSGLLA